MSVVRLYSQGRLRLVADDAQLVADQPGSGLTFGHKLKRSEPVRVGYSRGRVRMSDLTPAVYWLLRKRFISAWKRAGWSHMMKWALSGMRVRVSDFTGE